LDVEGGAQASCGAAPAVVRVGLRLASLGRQRTLRHLLRLDLGFTSAKTTAAPSGGSTRSPTTSRVFSAKSGASVSYLSGIAESGGFPGLRV